MAASDDTTWTRCIDPWERLRWSREKRYPTATAAAQALGLGKNTYSAYERPPGSSKHTKLDHQRAILFARRFKVSWLWLLLGEGTPFDQTLSPAQERIMAAMQGVDDGDQDRVADVVETMLRRAG